MLEKERTSVKKHEQVGITLTLESVKVRTVSVPLRRPIVAKVGQFTHWPLILIDLHTREGVVGRSLLEPYVQKSCPAIVSVIQYIAESFKGKPLAPLDVYGEAMKTLHLIGREGITVIALSGLDMAIWDALARAAGLPLEKSEVVMGEGPIRRVGEFDLVVHLHADIEATVKVIVVQEA